MYCQNDKPVHHCLDSSWEMVRSLSSPSGTSLVYSEQHGQGTGLHNHRCDPFQSSSVLRVHCWVGDICDIDLLFVCSLSTGIVNMGLSHSANNKWYFVIYYGVRSILFDTVIPFFVIFITNIQVIKQLKRSNEERKLLTSQQQKDRRTTTMLLVMVILYALCHMFNTSLKFVNLVFKTYAQFQASPFPQIPVDFFFQFTLIRVLHHVSNLLLVTYSMSTFFIYLIFSVKYRQVIAALVSFRYVYYT